MNARNAQILIALMKAHGIKILYPIPAQLTSNINVGTSVMRAPYFEMFSFVDERSVAYLACGLAAESGEPVALSRSGVTAHRRCKAERPGSDNTRRRTVHGG